MITRKIIVSGILSVLTIFAFSQEQIPSAQVAESAAISTSADSGQTQETVFAPFPVNLRIGVRGPELVITWQDSPDVSWGYKIYRSATIPDQLSYKYATLLGEAAGGTERFIYQVTDDKPYYYFILARTAENLLYEVFIPLKNLSLAPVSGEPVPKQAGIALATPEAVKLLPPKIEVQKVNDSIVVSLVKENQKGRMILYRSADRINTLMNLANSVVVAILDSEIARFTDYPIPGIPYFYAVLPESDLISGNAVFIAGQNASEESVLIPAGVYRTGLPASLSLSRTIPLPYLVLRKSISEATFFDSLTPDIKNTQLSPETEKSIALLIKNAGTKTLTELPAGTILSDDIKANSIGEHYTLKQVVNTFFANKKYAETIDQLSLFLSLPRGGDATARAHFYRGQAMANMGNLQDAFFEFLQAQERYYQPCSVWIVYILDALHGQN